MLVVDLQTDLIGLDATRFVAPLREEDAYARFPGLAPTVELDERSSCAFPEMAAVPAGELATRIASIGPARDELKRGLDILVDGF